MDKPILKGKNPMFSARLLIKETKLLTKYFIPLKEVHFPLLLSTTSHPVALVLTVKITKVFLRVASPMVQRT
jgi:hypothetical protein